MLRLTAIFIAVCMVLIAGSAGAVVYLMLGFSAAEASIVAIAVLTALALYNTVSGRLRDRSDVSNQIAALSRAGGDLARQVAELGRRLTAIESKADAAVDKALASTEPLAHEIGELGALVKQLAQSVAVHEEVLTKRGASVAATKVSTTIKTASEEPAAPAVAVETAGSDDRAEPEAKPASVSSSRFKGMERQAVLELIRKALDASRVDLYLQPIVTLPQRKVRYYEAMSRLKGEDGDVIPAGEFLEFAESGGLMPKLDNMLVFRCVQMVRRLLLKNRDIGLFCNISSATLTDADFQQFLEFVEANRALAPSLIFEFTQSAFRAMGPIEHESLAALAERGFRFSLDNLADLRMEPRDLAERGFRFIKAPAALLLSRVNVGASDIHPADLSDLVGRFGIDLIAEKIESEGAVVDLLDYDVRFGQGFLFSPPRPVRAEALQGVADRNDVVVRDSAPEPAPREPTATGERQSGFAWLARDVASRA